MISSRSRTCPWPEMLFDFFFIFFYVPGRLLSLQVAGSLCKGLLPVALIRPSEPRRKVAPKGSGGPHNSTPSYAPFPCFPTACLASPSLKAHPPAPPHCADHKLVSFFLCPLTSHLRGRQRTAQTVHLHQVVALPPRRAAPGQPPGSETTAGMVPDLPSASVLALSR